MSETETVRPVLEWVLRQYPETSKRRAKEWIETGRVSIAGEVCRKPQVRVPDPGASLQLAATRSPETKCGTGWRIHPRLSLIYLDPSLAILNKGAGLITVPAPNCKESALDILREILAGSRHPTEPNPAGRGIAAACRNLDPLPVHRLDQYTTGLFCAGMNPAARENLIAQLQARDLEREYIAFAEGRASAPRGTWRHWMQIGPDGLRQVVLGEKKPQHASPLAREAVTHFEVISEYPLLGGKQFVTRLRLRLDTGLKHQIRAQAAYAGLPLIGDRTYQGAESSRTRISFPRQALHSARISLQLPQPSGKKMNWSADLPTDLQRLERFLLNSTRTAPTPSPEGGMERNSGDAAGTDPGR